MAEQDGAEEDGRARMGGPAKLPPEVQERCREIVADRLGWPESALGNCRQVEAAHPLWHCWWTPDPQPYPGFSPAYGAAQTNSPPARHVILYARTPVELAGLISSKHGEGPQ